MAAKWLKFSWDLSALPATAGEIKPPLIIRPATKDEKDDVIKVMTSAFSMDSTWGDVHKLLTRKLGEKTEAIFGEKDPLCMVLQYGNRIIGTSVLSTEEDENHSNLITGPCILHEYRSRSYGSSLLGASLKALREAGLKRATGIAREKTTAARFLYTKFGGTSVEWISSDVHLQPKVAA